MRSLIKPIYLILGGQLVISLIFVFNRFVALDEGFYLAAAQRVADGMTLYQDFFFPQMPLLPLTFFGFSEWGINSLLLLRIIAALAGVLTTLTMYRIVSQHTKNDSLANIAAFFVAFSGISLNWHTVFKPYAFVDLFLLASFGLLLQARANKERLGWTIFATLLALGVAINFRSLLAVLIPVYGYLIFTAIKSNNESFGKYIAPAVAGLVLPTLPAIFFFLTSSDQFWFNNLIFHLNREPIESAVELIKHKALTVGKFIVLPQTILLLGMAVAAVYFLRSKLATSAEIRKPAFVVGMTLFLIYLVPTPLHLQYFQQTIPYLVILALPTAEFFRRYDTSRLISASAALIYIVGIAPFIYLFMLTPRDRDERLQWSHINAVVERIRSETFPSDTLLSEWAGYAALSGRKQLPGSEHVGFYFPLEVDSATYTANHLLTNDNIVDALADRRPRMVVIDYRIYPEWEPTLLANYNLIEQTGDTYLYKRNEENL